MKTKGTQQLAEGDYFYLHDYRAERALLANKKQYDCDPPNSRTLTEARIDHFKRVDPVGTKYTHARLEYYNRNFLLPGSLVHDRSCFRASAPSRLAHFDTVIDYCSHPISSTYCVVSLQWKDAINSLEPETHEFFPHKLIFSDRSADNHFIFRDRQQIDALCPWPAVPHFEEGELVWRRGANREMIDATLRRELISGHHFIRSNSDNLFISRALAERLYPLLPPKVTLFRMPLSST